MRCPLLLDVMKINQYLLDGIDILIRCTLQDFNFVFITNQQHTSSLPGSGAKRYTFKISDVSLDLNKIKVSNNSYLALEKTLSPSQTNIPLIKYLFISQQTKTFHIPSGQTQYIIDLPFSNKIPFKIFLAFQRFDFFNTKNFKINGLFLDHLNLKNILITINGVTLFNIDSNFSNSNVSHLYDTLLDALATNNHLISLHNFINGMTLLGFNLSHHDSNSNIQNNIFGNLRITLTFAIPITTGAVIYLLGSLNSILSINKNRDISLSI